MSHYDSKINKIGKSSFSFCKNLENMIIPENVISIADCAFRGCSKLAEITIPNSVTYVGKNLFDNCYSLSKIIVNNNDLILHENQKVLGKCFFLKQR